MIVCFRRSSSAVGIPARTAIAVGLAEATWLAVATLAHTALHSALATEAGSTRTVLAGPVATWTATGSAAGGGPAVAAIVVTARGCAFAALALGTVTAGAVTTLAAWATIIAAGLARLPIGILPALAGGARAITLSALATRLERTVASACTRLAIATGAVGRFAAALAVEGGTLAPGLLGAILAAVAALPGLAVAIGTAVATVAIAERRPAAVAEAMLAGLAGRTVLAARPVLPVGAAAVVRPNLVAAFAFTTRFISGRAVSARRCAIALLETAFSALTVARLPAAGALAIAALRPIAVTARGTIATVGAIGARLSLAACCGTVTRACRTISGPGRTVAAPGGSVASPGRTVATIRSAPAGATLTIGLPLELAARLGRPLAVARLAARPLAASCGLVGCELLVVAAVLAVDRLARDALDVTQQVALALVAETHG